LIENLGALVNLEELWLGKNKITKLEVCFNFNNGRHKANTEQNLDKLRKLRILSIQSNRITKLEGLDSLTELEEFYISNNGIKKLEGLENNVCSSVLGSKGLLKMLRTEKTYHNRRLKQLHTDYREPISFDAT
jgi:protein phosphatase 1 regulatory subunit 7